MSRRGRDLERRDRQFHTHVWWIQIRRDTWGARSPSPTPDQPALGASARKINPHNFWL